MKNIKVLLVGAPAGERVVEVQDPVEKVKVVRGNGYDHFTFSGESCDVGGSRMPVFVWHSRTRIAE